MKPENCGFSNEDLECLGCGVKLGCVQGCRVEGQMNIDLTARRLSEPPTKSTAHMDHDERVAGVRQMLLDLDRLARGDGCIAAAWALEVLCKAQKEKT